MHNGDLIGIVDVTGDGSVAVHGLMVGGGLDKVLIPELPKALAAWYADPLDLADAANLLEHGRRCAQRAYRVGGNAGRGELEQVIARNSLRQVTTDKLETLAATSDQQVRALAILIHGQFLMSRRIEGAIERLEQGFELARDRFLAPDFFVVMKRHELLAELPLYPQAQAPKSLKLLLNEAGVIRRLRGRQPIVVRQGQVDTMG